MNANLISALSALAGAVIGVVMSLLASWVANQRQVRSQWIAHDRSQREDLYKEFIEEAAKCYIDALLNEKPDISSVVVPVCQSEPYARPVVTSGRAANPTIINTCSAPYVIPNFSEKCRAEFDNLRAKQFLT